MKGWFLCRNCSTSSKERTGIPKAVAFSNLLPALSLPAGRMFSWKHCQLPFPRDAESTGLPPPGSSPAAYRRSPPSFQIMADPLFDGGKTSCTMFTPASLELLQEYLTMGVAGNGGVDAVGRDGADIIDVHHLLLRCLGQRIHCAKVVHQCLRGRFAHIEMPSPVNSRSGGFCLAFFDGSQEFIRVFHLSTIPFWINSSRYWERVKISATSFRYPSAMRSCT